EFFKLHADLTETGGHPHRLLTTPQETAGRAAPGRQRRLSQGLADALVPQGLQGAEEAPGAVDDARQSIRRHSVRSPRDAGQRGEDRELTTIANGDRVDHGVADGAPQKEALAIEEEVECHGPKFVT